MALQKDYALPGGFTGAYHRIIKAELDYMAGKARVHVALYKDRNYRLANSGDPAKTAEFEFGLPSEAYDASKSVRQMAYAALKSSVPFYADAVDVLEQGQSA